MKLTPYGKKLIGLWQGLKDDDSKAALIIAGWWLFVFMSFIGFTQVLILSICLLILINWLYSLFHHIAKSSKPRIDQAPGTRLLRIVDFFFSPKTVEQTFKPLVADWHYEHFEALNQGRKYKAHWISFRYRFIFACTFIKAMGLSKIFSIFKQISK